jgi:hypothetical protein
MEWIYFSSDGGAFSSNSVSRKKFAGCKRQPFPFAVQPVVAAFE